MVQVQWEGFGGDLVMLQTQLDHLLAEAEGRTAVLMDSAGRLLTLAGDSPRFDLTTFVSLMAADFCATRELARMLGEEQFQSVAHQGEEVSLYLTQVTPGTILAMLYDRTSTLGLVRYCVRRALPGLGDSIQTCLNAWGTPERPLADGFSAEALDRVDGLFDSRV
jgi:predicted regulator of Ras-like GTPase activity (Roadblock/LC7/MglB family)